jgi:microcystin-dependent protein
VYYDDVEITAKLNELNSIIVAERNRELSDNYYSKTDGDAAIDAAIDTHHINTVPAAISSAVANVATNEHIDIELENMALKTELNAAVDAYETPYLTKAKYDGDKPIYSTMDYLHKRLPRGSILMWNKATIPDGWELCTNLNGRFIVGMGNGYNLNQTGGLNHITITQDQMPTHAHGASSTSKLGSHSHAGTNTSTESYNHDHTGTITGAGVTHKHTYSIGKQDTNHSHNFTIHHKAGLTHVHGSNNGGHHNHTSIIATDGGTVNRIRNDDFNNSNPGLGNNEGDGASWQGGLGKIGYIYTGSDSGHNHNIPDASPSHPHALGTGNQLQNHIHVATIAPESSAHNHNISGINNVTRTHNHTVTVTGEDMNHNHSITVDALGGGQSYDNRPPYYALKFIKKL